jgi:hypothetical protein
LRGREGVFADGVGSFKCGDSIGQMLVSSHLTGRVRPCACFGPRC